MRADADAARAERQRVVFRETALLPPSVVITGASSSSASAFSCGQALRVMDALAGIDDRPLGRDERLGDL